MFSLHTFMIIAVPSFALLYLNFLSSSLRPWSMVQTTTLLDMVVGLIGLVQSTSTTSVSTMYFLAFSISICT